MSLNPPTAYGVGGPFIQLDPKPIPSQRNPATSDINYQIGQRWINESNNTEYSLTSKSAGAAHWTALGTGAVGGVVTLTGTTGGAISPSAGNINILGNATQGVSSSGSGSTITYTVADWTTAQKGVGVLSSNAQAVTGTGTTQAVTPAALTARLQAPGAIGGTTPAAATFTHLNITTGANTTIGTSAAMTAGSITISTTAVTASSKIFLTTNTPGGTQGVLSAPTASIVAGTSFVINSSNASDTSTVNWWIIN